MTRPDDHVIVASLNAIRGVEAKSVVFAHD